MRVLICTIEQGRKVLQKEADKWWSGIASMEVKLGYPASELEKLFWLTGEFNIEMEDQDLKVYKKEEVDIAIVRHGKLYPEKITSYRSGRRRFVTKNDFDYLSREETNGEKVKGDGEVSKMQRKGI